MPKLSTITGRMVPNDYFRVLLTDTSPFEVPIIFSNNQFYKNVAAGRKFDSHFNTTMEALFANHKYTIPYRYNIAKDSQSVRKLSLIHPASQLEICFFYQGYEHLICYYSSISKFTIRAPHRVGSTFYFRSSISDKNKYRNNSVDTTDVDNLIRNPASFFAYKGYDRLYKFFNSIHFLSIEKKYRYMLSLDISKCFSSIYTHSIAWALKDIHTAKQNIISNHFGSQFDSLMQKTNYNETNGICIGPETSRIFAEIIFCKIDSDIEKRLLANRLRHNHDYAIHRYVDNYYVFSNSPEVADQIKDIVSFCLGEYKLHLNSQKTEHLSRPFYTKKSRIIDEVSSKLSHLFDLLIEYDYNEGDRYSFPIKIRKYNSLYKSSIRDIKNACLASDSHYEDVASYIISAMSIRIENLTENIDLGLKQDDCDEDAYIEAFILMLELSFFFYNMSPTVAASLSLSKSIVITARAIRSSFPSRLPFLQDRVVRWTMQLVKSANVRSISRKQNAIPIEILNILIAMHDIAADYNFSEKMYREILLRDSKLDYFSAISSLFIIRDRPNCESLRHELFNEIKHSVLSNDNFLLSSHDIHLFLDIIACPHLDINERVNFYKEVATVLKIKKPNNAEATLAVQECEAASWFVSWKGVDLLSLITKKQLSNVY